MNLLLPRLGLAAFLVSCGPSSKPATIKQPDPVDTTTTTQPTQSAHDAAVANVTRLKAEADQHPLLAPWTGPYGGVPPWDKVKSDLFAGAFTLGIELRNAEIDAIASDPEPPTFANTFVPLEDAGRHQDRAENLFGVMTNNMNSPEYQAVDKEWSPKLAAAYDEITFHSKLFARIAAIYDGRAQAGLTPEQLRLVERTYDRFVRAGAKLDDAQKQQLGAINQELASLFTEFAQKVLADENTWVVLDKQADLLGLPKSLVASYKAAADERGLAGKWVVVNTRSSVDPFLTESSRRDLREKVWKAFKNRGDNGNENDTNATIAKIVKLRADRAKLLGYPTHAHWRMSDTMAVDPAKADELMLRVWPAAVARVKEEVADMQKIAKKEKLKGAIEPWDYLYFAENVRKQK
jgi:peptidyl-dipeptidase Dcp